ncbi:hypothetical protein [Nonomuraea sp. NPDC048826]|uniref:hypothetical protein n=1 Tax=Nonomuraea sp. NPDC048826 TaxID=3364347 RepID=UPI003711988A
MAIVVTFTGRTVLPGSDSGLRIWSYKVEPSMPGEIPANSRIALGLPRDVDVRDPALYPGVTELQNTFLVRDPNATRQYVGREAHPAGALTISFVAPSSSSTSEVMLVKMPTGQTMTPLSFALSPGGAQAPVQTMTAPLPGRPAFHGRPLSEFKGSLPYASELFGVYQPLAGWFGALNTRWALSRSLGESRYADLGDPGETAARMLEEDALAAVAGQCEAGLQGVLSPVGLVNLFREYFFEFDSFLGVPAGHVWLSPGGTVELVETSTRRTLVEKTAEQSLETSRKVEESLTTQDDVADAVKEANANDTKLGVSATGGVNAPIFHADASASFSTQSTRERSSEQTHKHSRTQSAKVASEIKRNFKTTFKTVTETTDTASRRYVLHNASAEDLVNYELRRKMRKVGVQLQHIGSRLAWQIYIDEPGRHLGLGDLVDMVPAPDLTAIPRPEVKPYPAEQRVTHALSVPFRWIQGDESADQTYVTSSDNIDHGINKDSPGVDDIIQFRFDLPLPPPPDGYEIKPPGTPPLPPPIDFHGAQVQFTAAASDLNMTANPDPARNVLGIRLTYANFQTKKSMPFDVTVVYTPKAETKEAIDAANKAALDEYAERVAKVQHEAYGNAVRERLKKVSLMRSRSSEDLRKEERHTVFRNLIRRVDLGEDPHLGSELIQQLFDVDEMLYFVAPDFWRPSTTTPPTTPPPPTPPEPTQGSVGHYPLPAYPPGSAGPALFTGETVASQYSFTDVNNALDPNGNATPEWRVNYLITEESQPAPMGSSLGWLIQLDGDERRNEFLNAAWAKAVLPVRPGHEMCALQLLRKIEGEGVFQRPYAFQEGDPAEYQNKTVGEVLQLLAGGLQQANRNMDNVRAAEKVFETGFDPLEGGFRPAEPYQVFDQWIEVLPTDQVVAVEVRYDPKTGQQL